MKSFPVYSLVTVSDLLDTIEMCPSIKTTGCDKIPISYPCYLLAEHVRLDVCVHVLT